MLDGLVCVALDVEEIFVEGALSEPQACDDVLLLAVRRRVLGFAADLRFQGSVVAPGLARAVVFLPQTLSVFVDVDEFLLRLQWQKRKWTFIILICKHNSQSQAITPRSARSR